jgi:deoxyadenosine/deoxycytidine kinase
MYLLEGNIGAGKSTFLQLITKHLPHTSVAFEPLHNWQGQVFGQSLLANFYQDPKRWAYTLETLAMLYRARDHVEAQNNPVPYKIFERSIYSGHYCFSKNSYESGFLNTLEWGIYNTWFTFLTEGKCTPPTGFIYLKVHPEVSYERIQKRNRSAEKNITLEYLQQIDRCHEEFLIEKKNVSDAIKRIPVLVVDCNQEFEHASGIDTLHNIVRQVDTFMMQTQNSTMDNLPESPIQKQL